MMGRQALVVSQDQDLPEVAEEIEPPARRTRLRARGQRRVARSTSLLPDSDACRSARPGRPGLTWSRSSPTCLHLRKATRSWTGGSSGSAG